MLRAAICKCGVAAQIDWIAALQAQKLDIQRYAATQQPRFQRASQKPGSSTVQVKKVSNA